MPVAAREARMIVLESGPESTSPFERDTLLCGEDMMLLGVSSKVGRA